MVVDEIEDHPLTHVPHEASSEPLPVSDPGCHVEAQLHLSLDGEVTGRIGQGQHNCSDDELLPFVPLICDHKVVERLSVLLQKMPF